MTTNPAIDLTNNTITEFHRALELYREHPTMREHIHAVFGNTDIPANLPKIMKNPKLFYIYRGANCLKFNNIGDALNELTEDRILVYIVELSMYGVFAPDDYINFLGNIRGNSTREEKNLADYKASSPQ